MKLLLQSNYHIVMYIITLLAYATTQVPQPQPQPQSQAKKHSAHYFYYLMDGKRFPYVIGNARMKETTKIEIKGCFLVVSILLLIYIVLVVLVIMIAIFDEFSISVRKQENGENG